MTLIRLAVAAIAAFLFLAACDADDVGTAEPDETTTTLGSDTEDTDTTTTLGSDTEDTDTTTTSDLDDADLAGTVAEIQTQVENLSAAIQGSDVGPELESAWEQFQSDIGSEAESFQEDGSFDTSQLAEGIEDFQDTLESAGDDVDEDVRQAWDELRSTLEQLMS